MSGPRAKRSRKRGTVLRSIISRPATRGCLWSSTRTTSKSYLHKFPLEQCAALAARHTSPSCRMLAINGNPAGHDECQAERLHALSGILLLAAGTHAGATDPCQPGHLYALAATGGQA